MGKEVKQYLLGQIIIGLIGALLLLIEDFAGFYHYDYYNKIEIWGSIYLGSGFLGSLLIIIGAATLLYVAYSAYTQYKKSHNLQKHINQSKWCGLFVAGLAFVGGLLFVIITVLEETQSWWLDTGFYAAIIAGILIVYFGYKLKN